MIKRSPSLKTIVSMMIFSFFLPLTAFAQEASGGEARSALSIVSDAGFIGILLILIFAAGLVLLFYSLIYHNKDKLLPEGLYTQLDQLLEEGEYEDALQLCSVDDCLFAKVMAPAIRDVEIGYDAMYTSMQNSLDEQATVEHQLTGWLNTIAAVAPRLRLFGTISWMIDTFASIVASGGSPSPAELAGGIQKALGTTFLGLSVAIPFLIIYAVFRDRADRILMLANKKAEDLLLRFKGSEEE
jgi:biopolymer transport protein ExbB